MTETKHPNVILCVCDELRAFEVGCYGNSAIRTPNLDRLAAEGVRFETAVSNNPLCTPARSCLLSGQYARTCNAGIGCVGEPDPTRQHFPSITLPEALREAGYRTGLVGKWHLQPTPDLIGFDDYVYPRVPHRHTHREYSDNNHDAFVVENWTWDFDMERAREFVTRPREEPFFLYFNIEPPHMPLADAPEYYTQMYSRDEVPLRPNVFQDGQLPYDEHWFKVYLWDYLYYKQHLPHTEKLPDDFDLRDVIALYYGLTTLVDDQVGKLMALLRESGLAENTIVVFTSDHGDSLGSHGYYNKGRLIEESIRIPLIYHSPQRLQPRVVTEQVTSLVDVMPTLLTLADVPFPQTVQGTDVTPVLSGEQSTCGENVAFIECVHAGSRDDPNGGVGIRTQHHTYGIAIEQGQYYGYLPESRITDDRLMFYDLRDDPYQMNNLAKTEAQPEVAAELRERVVNWHRSVSPMDQHS